MTDTCERHGINPNNPRRYPLQPLADHFPGLPLRAVCEQLKVSGSTYEAYLCHGVLAKTADMLAARAGIPTYSVWPEMIDDLIAESSLTCAECGDRFLRPALYGRPPKYCGAVCRRRVARRAYIARKRQDPAYREKERAQKRAYYAETREYSLRWQKQYDAAHRDQIAAQKRALRRRKQETSA